MCNRFFESDVSANNFYALNSKDLKSGAQNLMDFFDHMITFYFQIIRSLQVGKVNFVCLSVGTTDLQHSFAVQVFLYVFADK